MAIITGQVATAATAATSATALCTIPPGACNVIITATGGTAAVGPTPPSTAQSLLLGNCLQVVPGAAPTSFTTFPASRGTGLSVLSASTAVTATVSYLISTES